ncbi:MAG TPA: flagellar protein FlaG [Steroidobacteraceae bacterium]|nr:flagellar protein FlaG [Steroidobacteraceae bacterium]
MTEELDSILPVGASSSSGFSGSRVDVIHAPQPIPPVRPAQRPAPSPAAAAAGGSPGGGASPRLTAAQAAQSLQESVDRLNARLASSNRVVELRVDAETGITIAEIKNPTTGVVVQQIPGTDVVHLAEMLSAWAHGKNILVDLIA